MYLESEEALWKLVNLVAQLLRQVGDSATIAESNLNLEPKR